MNSLDEEVQMKLLQIDSSARRTSSVSRQLTAKFAEEWRKSHPDGEVIQRDLPQPHFHRLQMTGARPISKIRS